HGRNAAGASGPTEKLGVSLRPAFPLIGSSRGAELRAQPHFWSVVLRGRAAGRLAAAALLAVTAGLDEVALQRVTDELGPGGQAELLLHARAVRLDRAHRQEQLACDLGVGVAERDQAQH